MLPNSHISLSEPLTIRGKRHSVEAIEATVERSHALVAPGRVAAFRIWSHDGEALGVAVEVVAKAPGFSAGSILTSLRRAVIAAHGLRPRWIALVPPRGLPGGAAGRPARREVRRALLAGEIPVLAEDGGAMAEPPVGRAPAGYEGDVPVLPWVVVG